MEIPNYIGKEGRTDQKTKSLIQQLAQKCGMEPIHFILVPPRNRWRILSSNSHYPLIRRSYERLARTREQRGFLRQPVTHFSKEATEGEGRKALFGHPATTRIRRGPAPLSIKPLPSGPAQNRVRSTISLFLLGSLSSSHRCFEERSSERSSCLIGLGIVQLHSAG